MKQITILAEKQAQKLAALELENKLESAFAELTGIVPSIISAYSGRPFATFKPKNVDEYLTILNKLEPTGENFLLQFAGKASVQTFSPYSIHYGGLHDSSTYMDATVKFKHSICPVWVDMPKEMIERKFSVSRKDGAYIGFGRYETKYTLSANEGKTTVQTYYGESKTMYAAIEGEASQLKDFIFFKRWIL